MICLIISIYFHTLFFLYFRCNEITGDIFPPKLPPCSCFVSHMLVQSSVVTWIFKVIQFIVGARRKEGFEYYSHFKYNKHVWWMHYLILFNPKLRGASAQTWFVFISRFVAVCLKLVILIQPNVSQQHPAWSFTQPSWSNSDTHWTQS